MENEELHCIGCGAIIQSEDPNALGYAPASSLGREQVICKRCYRLKHYNEVQDVSLTDDDFLRILNGLGAKKGLIVMIVDIFDFDGSWLPGLQRFVGNNPILLLGNKVDLLPHSLKRPPLMNWMRGRVKELGMKPVAVDLISSLRDGEISPVLELIEKHRNGGDVYVVGCTNVGKSTFINRIIHDVSGEKDIITTSHFPGTTLDTIEIPLDDGSMLVDTPGIINHHQMAHVVTSKTLKAITPKKEIKPVSYQLNEEQTLFFGGLARLDYISGGRRSLTCYLPNSIKIHRTKLEKADELYANHLGELLQPPFAEDVADFPKLVGQDFHAKAKMDIVFSGLGWVTVEEGAHIKAWVPENVNVTIRKSIM
ncbi:ribosome biogenesis GTPase YqeH [Brochothrix thermosphacta]|uniref:ribosome biogenesis GTPase YqeH n=1 Tax=Brochothrix thermosphacta TaxID=2756 RepID=UPI00083F8542|nr:ribosome biogenesis GTPase YqeH [Brochothrix thermosphacta]ODJ57632.1 ribosome biogenesis GTPase YqeH [Brochothrix thermosphacta]